MINNRYIVFKRDNFPEHVKPKNQSMTGFLVDDDGNMYHVQYSKDDESSAPSMRFQIPHLSEPDDIKNFSPECPMTVPSPVLTPPPHTVSNEDVLNVNELNQNEELPRDSNDEMSGRRSLSPVYVNIGTPSSPYVEDVATDDGDLNPKYLLIFS